MTKTAGLVESALEGLERKGNSSYPLIVQSWKANWQRVIPFFAYPSEIRKVIYTTSAIEPLNMRLRKVTKAKGAFSYDEAVLKSSGWRCGASAKMDDARQRLENGPESICHQFEDRFPAQ